MMMKNKKLIIVFSLIIVSSVLVTLIGYWAYRYYINEADTLIVLSNKSNIDPVDIQVFVDDSIVLSKDVVKNSFLSYKRRLNFGIHDIEIRSKKGNVIMKTKIICYYVHYILIEFYDDSTINFSDREEGNNNFYLRKSILPIRAS